MYDDGLSIILNIQLFKPLTQIHNLNKGDTSNMSTNNNTDVAEFLNTLGIGSLAPKLSEALTDLAIRVDNNDVKGSITLKFELSPHKVEGVLKAKSVLSIEKPKRNGMDKDITQYSDVLRIDENGINVLSNSEIDDL